jgi:hypothetical protein
MHRTSKQWEAFDSVCSTDQEGPTAMIELRMTQTTGKCLGAAVYERKIYKEQGSTGTR